MYDISFFLFFLFFFNIARGIRAVHTLCSLSLSQSHTHTHSLELILFSNTPYSIMIMHSTISMYTSKETDKNVRLTQFFARKHSHGRLEQKRSKHIFYFLFVSSDLISNISLEIL